MDTENKIDTFSLIYNQSLNPYSVKENKFNLNDAEINIVENPTNLIIIKIPIHNDEDMFWAEVPQLPGCYSQGKTMSEFEENIFEAIFAYLETLNESDPLKILYGNNKFAVEFIGH
jgi:predicted RNase H-like HicB family nuclease